MAEKKQESKPTAEKWQDVDAAAEKKPAQQKNRSTLFAVLVALLLLVVSGTPYLFSGDSADTAASAIIEPQAIADYLFDHGELPENFITKDEAEALGWDSSKNYVSDVAPGKSIGGDRFGNYEGLLPDAENRTWQEADANYVEGPRNGERIVFSSDGLVYYTDDHYESFTQMQPSD